MEATKEEATAAIQVEAEEQTTAAIQVEAAEEQTAAAIQVGAAEETTTAAMQVEGWRQQRRQRDSSHSGGGRRGDCETAAVIQVEAEEEAEATIQVEAT